MSQIEIYTIVTLSVLSAFQFFYWSFFMFRIRKRKAKGDNMPPISIIVCAKNEAYNLTQLVPMLFSQNYKKYQVVVVDDCSTDDTALELAELKARYPDLYYTSIPVDKKFHHGKKLAITLGIKAAVHEHLVFIDADCRPASNDWLTEIGSSYTDGKEIVIGYGRYAKERGFLNFFIRFETFWNAVQYFGYAVAWRPFMAVGRNMSYTKTLYNQSSKFRYNIGVLSGDDDMFVSEMGTRRNTAVCYSQPSHTESEPKHTWKSFFEQKARHLSTAPYYNGGIKTMLSLEVITRQLLFFGIILTLVFGGDVLRIVAASLWFVRQVLMHTSLGIAQSRMGERGLWPYTLVMDIIVPYIQALCWLWNLTTKHRDTWK